MIQYRNIEKFLIFFTVFSSIGILFLLAPIIALFLMLDPSVFRKTLFSNPLLSNEAWQAFYITFTASTISTAILLFLGVPIAYLLAKRNFLGKRIVESIVDIPLMIPHVVAGIMILVAYSRRGLMGGVTSVLGFNIEDAFWGIVFVMIFVSAPIMIDTLKIGFEKVDVTLEYVSRSLGANSWKMFHTITLPLSLPNIISGSILSWARAVSEVGAILIVAYYPKSANILVLEWFNTYGLKYAVSLSIVLVIVSFIVFLLLRLVFKGD